MMAEEEVRGRRNSGDAPLRALKVEEEAMSREMKDVSRTGTSEEMDCPLELLKETPWGFSWWSIQELNLCAGTLGQILGLGN